MTDDDERLDDDDLSFVFDRDSPDWQHNFIRLITLNIRNGGYSNLNVVLRAIHQMRVDIGILTETKIDNDMYTRDCCGYTIFASQAKSKHQGGVALFYRTTNSRWWIEGERAHGPNVVSCVLVSGNRRWNVLGVYVPPSEDDGETLHFVNEAVQYRGTNDPYILLGDLNVDLDRPKDFRGDEILSQVILMALEDVGDHYAHPRGRWTWSQYRTGRYIRSKTCYILAQELADFKRWAIKIPRIDTDHRAIIAEMHLDRFYMHRRYTCCRRHLPDFPFQRPLSENDDRFQHLKEEKELPDPRKQRDRSWISKRTWTLIDKKVHAIRWRYPSDVIRDYGKDIRKSLRKDRRQRAERVSRQIEQKLTSRDIRGAYDLLRGWYRRTGGKPPRPTRKDLDMIRTSFKNLYREQEPPGDPLPVHISPAPVRDGIPDDDEILLAVKTMRRRSVPGASGIRVRDILYWHRKLPDVWNEFVLLVQDCFDGKPLPQEFSYEILCLLPKNERGKYRGIVLLEVAYKVLSRIIHLRMEDKIDFHPAIHGFRHKRGTGTCILEAKLRMQLASYQCLPLYQLYLDLTKAYDCLNRKRTMSLLEAYGVGPCTRSIIEAVWDHELLVPKSSDCYGQPFHASRGVRQGDIISPVIFNVIVDAVLREWDICAAASQLTGLSLLFYADDGRMAGDNPETLQDGLNLLVDLFKRLGLYMNSTKTKAMIFFGGSGSRHMAPEAYARRFNKSLPTHRERSLQKVQCLKCAKFMNRQHLTPHMREVHHEPLLSNPSASISQVPAIRIMLISRLTELRLHMLISRLTELRPHVQFLTALLPHPLAVNCGDTFATCMHQILL